MGKIAKLRCPNCGMLGYLRNFASFHKIEAFIHHTGSKGRGRIYNYYQRQIPDNLIDYWIERLEKVIEYLKNLKVKKIVVEISTSEKNLSSVLETSVSPMMELKSELTPTVILNVPKYSLITCTKKVKK